MAPPESRSSSRFDAISGYDALLLTALLWFLAKFLRYAFPPLFEPLQAEYPVSEAALGASFTAFMLVYAAMQFPSGILGDRLGPVRVVVAGAVVAIAGSFVVAAGALAVVDAPFWLIVLAMVVIGAGTGAHKTVAIGMLSRIYPARTGRVLGIHDTLGTFGGVAAPAAVALALRAGGAGWQTVFLGAAIVGVLVVVAFAIRVPRRLPAAPGNSSRESDQQPAEQPTLRAYAAPFRSWRFSGFVVVTLCFGFAYNGIVAFLPLYLVRQAGLTTTGASLLYGVLFAVTLVQLVTGELSDRVGRLPVVAATIGLATAALAILVATPAIGPVWSGIPIGTALVVGAIGLGTHGFRPVRAAHLDALLPRALAGGGLGVVRSGLMGAGAVAPAIVGVVAERAGFRPAFALLLAVLATALAIVLGLWVTQCGRSAR